MYGLIVGLAFYKLDTVLDDTISYLPGKHYTLTAIILLSLAILSMLLARPIAITATATLAH
jgi:hypothetical protein